MLNKQHSLDSDDEGASIDNAASLVALLRLRAERQAQRTAYTFLENGEQPFKSITYAELDLQARQLAVQLQALGLQGERAILLYPPELDYIVAFFACLYAGVIAVPAYPPTNGRHMPRLQVIIDDSQAAVILSTQSVANAVRQFAVGSACLLDKNWLMTDNLAAVDASAWRLPTLHSRDPAFLQYTSGSTGNAKGVIISHDNLMANQQLIKRRFGHNAQSTVVGWLPLYHDMGLIGNVMQPLYCGTSAVLMSPMAFLEKPLRWLQAISDYRAHTSGGPNFAYELCARKITDEEKAGLDLSNWRLAFNGAEPINPNTLDRFAAAFAVCGFGRKAFYPCYGLAEATLLATGGEQNAEPTVAAFYKAGLEQGKVRPAMDADELSRSLVGCGAIDVDFGQQIRIVDPETGEPCSDDQIGEIQLGGPSISLGYWQNSAATEQAFISDADGQNRWLRTGDLGFIERGELFVSGRLKDLIIIRGRNYYPHDLEYAVEAATDALTPGCAAAFAVSGDNGEKLVVLAELKRNRLRQPDYRAEFAAIRTRLVEECGIQADTVMLLKPGSILKTSSGKVRRSGCRQAFEQQQLKVVAVDELNGESCEVIADSQSPDWKPAQTRQALLSVTDAEGARLLAQVLVEKVAALSGLAVAAVDVSQSLPSLGMDSLKAVELKYFIDELLAIDLPVVQLLGNYSLVTCAEQALKLAKADNVQIAPVAVDEQALSFGQQALWTVNQIEADSSLYNMPVAMHIRGRLDKTVLHGALAALFERHAQLRSGFRLNRQTRTVRIPLAKSQIRLLSASYIDEQQRSVAIAAFVRKPFDLEHGPLLRAALFSCADDDHVLAFCVHHIVVDFCSLVILLEEFKSLYLGQIAGHDRNLPKPAESYADYVAWQSAYLADERAEQDWQYWQRQLSGELPKLILPVERQTSGSPSCRGRAETLNIAPDTLQKLKRLAAEQHTTLYTLLLTVFKTLLYRYSGQQDIIVGSPTLGRPKRDFADTVGYFVNPVALRSNPAAEQRFSDYLAEVNATVLDAQAHQHYPFSLLVEKLQPEREQGPSAFYSVWFGLQSGAGSVYDAAELALGMPGIALDWAGLSVESYALDDVAVQFDMTLLMAETQQGLAASFQYRSDLLSHATVLRFIGHYQYLLHGILANPDGRLSELSLLSLSERNQIAEWNSTGIDYPNRSTIHSVFEAVARQQPQAIALVYQELGINYAELNAQANRLAQWLREQGAGPEKRVALCIQRCPEMVVGILAILKAGAVYVPVDPAYPKDRQTYLLQDAGCEWLLTSTVLLPSLDYVDAATMCVDDVDAYAGYSSDNPEIPLHADHAAYVIYTSGSTGNPKGVVVSHGNLMHSTWVRNAYYKEPVGCYLLLSSFAFDSSVAGLFWTLGQGGCLCLPEDDQIKDPASLAELIASRQVTHLLALPSFYALLLSQAGAQLQTLKTAIVAGEACSTEVVKQHYAVLPQVQLYNEYGPTEGTVWSSVYPASQDDLDRPLSIGRPIDNVKLYILDGTGNQVPIGVQGELHIGGEGIVRGYWQRPELTAEKFIPDPFQADSSRLYKTGDLARYRPDGNIEFLGRIDHQVKIRGFRIELGEIEARLLEAPEINEAAVIARDDQPGDKRLVAYLVAGQENTVNIDQLKARLKETLPDYMVPSAFVLLDSMPLSANGKLDHKRLPQPDMSGLSAQHYQEAQTPVERILANIWRELLAVKRVGRHDNFFELGGDSILSIQVVSRARQAGVVITPKQLFQNQTISTLAVAAEQIQQLSAEQGLVSGHVPLTPIQQWFFEQNLSNPHHWNQALLLEVKPGLTPDILEAALKQLLNHHDALRMRFNQQGGEWQQHLLKDEPQAVFEHIDLADVPTEWQAEMLESAASIQQAQLHLSEGPLLRAVWFDLGEGQADRVLIAIHHLVVDGVSWRILLEDLASVCLQLMAGQTPVLPAKTSSFKYWSEQIVNQAGAGGLPLDNAYWLDARWYQVSTLPVDEANGSNLFATEDEITVTLTEAETRTLLQDVPGAYRTKIDELLLTALTLTLRDWMHSESVLIDLEGHGREDIAGDVDISRTVGWFTTVYPALLSISGNSSLGDVLKSVKEQLRAVPMKGMSYGLLRYVSPDAEIKAHLAAQPKAQVIFNYLGQFDTAMAVDAPFVLTRESTGANCDSAGIRAHELAIIGSIADGRMQLSWRYSRERYRKATIATLSEHYVQHLKALIAHCALPDSGSYTPSDFPLITLAQSDLDAMALKPRQIEDVYPLAPLQYGLMFHSLYAPELGVYSIQVGCRLLGDLNIPAFKQAWQQLVEHHPILRTRFHFENQDQPLQIVHKHAQLPITEYDWRAYPAQEQAQRWQQLQADDQKNGFDFTQAPLMRLGLVQCSDKAHYFLWSYHHTLLDGWSTPLLIKDLFAAYERIRCGDAAFLPAARSYRDYIDWLQNQDMASAEAYWRAALSGFTATTPIIMDKPADNSVQHQAHDYDKQHLTLSAAHSHALQDFVKQQQLTVNTLVQGTWGLLLSRYSGENDIVFGATVSGRPADLTGVESMVGLFINTLPLRIKITPDSTLLGWLQALFAQNQDMRRYEYTPLMQVQGWSELSRGSSLFESLLVFENYPINQVLSGTVDGLTIDTVSVIDQTNYPLTVSAFPGTELRLEITYDADRFEAETVKQMLMHMQRLLEAFARQPQARLSELSLLSAADKQQILVDWNATESAYPADLCLHQLFEAQVEKTPDADAVAFAGKTLSYAELNAKANQLAHYLRAKGVGSEVLVGLCIERSLDMVVGLLGILKAGGAYVPLDPYYPEERIRYMLDDAGVKLLLTRKELTETLLDGSRYTDSLTPSPAGEGWGEENQKSNLKQTIIYLDQDCPLIAHCSEHNPSSRNHPQDPAYIIYTSGSTGQPKGVTVTHRNAVHSTSARFAHYPDPVNAYLLLSSFAFDSSVAGLFWTLGQGGCLCLPDDEAGKDPVVLAELIERHQISHLLALPSLYALLLNQPAEKLRSLNTAIVAGETCATDVVKHHFAVLPQVKLHNEYGPTEASVWTSAYRASLDDIDRPLAIGRPINNVRLYILDKAGNPVPVGVAGEIHIGGSGIVRGYLHRPELTAEKFVPDPFQADGGRLYKTGDLARYRTDGAVEFLGRIDHQVKIRGFRIELGEIEAQLVSHAEVKEAAVLAREDQPGDKKLVAYLVLERPDAALDDIKVQLKQTLTDYMVPSAFVILEAMPLSANGKLDRKRLPAPDWSGQANAHYEPPQTPAEETLAAIWQQLLGFERVGRHDNFFELGGDSILSIQVVSRARQAGIVITPKQLFQQPTIAELAAVATARSQAVAEQGLVTGELPLTPIQHWFFERGLSNPHHWNQALLLTVKAELTPEVFKAAVHKLLVHHDALRMRFNPADGRWQQTNLSEEPQNVFEHIDLSAVPPTHQTERLQAESTAVQAALHLSKGPLLRAVWFDLGGERGSQVLIAIHHLVVDGVSWRILLEDLSLACRQGLAGQCLSLSAKTTSFQHWAQRLTQLTQSGSLSLAADYWQDPRRRQVPLLPVDDPTGANHADLEDEIVVVLSAQETRTLLQDVPAAYRTQIDEVLLTALALTLRDWTQASTLLIDREGHGREHLSDDLDVSRTVGWFTSVYPLLLNLPDGDSLAQALKTVKEQLRAVPDKGIGYGLLRYLSADAELKQHLAAQPPAQIIFNYLGQLDTVLSADEAFTPSSDAAGLSYDPAGSRVHELDVVGSIQEGCLQLSWRYSRERYRRATLEILAERYVQHLRELIIHCSQADVGGYTPSDFPLAALSQSQLDGLALPPRQIEDIYPLAPLQHGLMFHSLYQPDANVYRIQLACRLTGALNVAAFQQAWQQLIERHAILRTRFQFHDLEQPLQIVDKQAFLPISQHDWRELTETKRKQHWQALQAADHAQGFDFGRTPLMRLTLAQCADDQHYLLWSYHHVLLDGWSMPLLIKEVFAAYQALQRGDRPNLPAVKPYRDYIAWLQRQDRAAAETYWRQTLAGFETPTVLGSDLASSGLREAGETHKQSLLLSEADTQRLQQFVKRRQLTLNTLAQAAWGLLLSRHSGSDDVVFGVTVSGRPAELIGVEDQVGLFINTLPMRIKTPPQSRVQDWLQALFEQNQEMRRYEYTPLAQIQNGSDIGRGQNLFDTLLVFENYPIDQALMDVGGPLKIDQVVGVDPTNYPLTLTVFPGKQLMLEISHDNGRFTADSVVAMLAQLEQQLSAFAEQPEARLSELPTLTPTERQQILYDWNATEVEYPQDRCIHQLFEAQAERSPDAVALKYEEQSLSYAELNAKANRLAHYLIGQGVGPDVLVGICLERSLDMVIGLLGILKAGGAYVPLDPHYPKERLEFMLSDIAPPVVLIQAGLAARRFGLTQVLSLDSDWSQVEMYPTVNPDVALSPENLAYCIYTSGSTGQPKGAGVPHQGILNRLQWMQTEYQLDHLDNVLQKTPYSFDVSVWEFFWPLMAGARLVIAKPEQHKDSLALVDIIRHQGITTIHFVPSMLQAFVETPGVEYCTSLKRVICSGEALPANLVIRFQQKLSAGLHNLYGPTEASVDVSYWACPPDCEESAIPIGKPIANISLYVLDRDLNPVLVGTAGELHIAGIGLGRGYLNRSGLTAEKFIPDPYGSAGSRMYKTGDLVRYQSDGNIDYLGRIDHQVKIRGFRIELGEIEAQLLTHSEVKEAAVLVREDQPGDKRLVAYLVENQLGTLQLDSLKDQLKDALPEYMVPSAFVIIEEMPLTANGKLNRKQLPQLGIVEQFSKQYVAPTTETETILVEIWQEVLGLEKVGIEDDFFELGGHSLLATQLFFNVQRRLIANVAFNMFLAGSTVSAQARLIDGSGEIAQTIDLNAEAMLDQDIMPLGSNSNAIDVAATQEVFLTGATGFLGAFLLADLLELTQANVYCLVRAANERQALDRLKQQIAQYGLSDRVDFSRIVAVCGDLAEPRLGLSESRYQEIAERVEVIFHNGALVNFVKPYLALKAANVSGTREVLRLACFGRAKAIHYVSTVSVFSEAPRQITGHKETDDPEQRGNLPNGYAQSKWVAEKLVVAARERGFQVCIYRPAIVAGDSRSGAWNTSDFWCRLIKGCIQIGCAPQERVQLDMAPVDYMSRAIIALSLQRSSIGGIFHLNHPVPPYTDQWLDGFANLGYQLQRVTYRDWLEKVLEFGRSDIEDFALASLLPMFAERYHNGDTDVSEDSDMQYDSHATNEALSALGVQCPPFDQKIIVRYQAYFVREGFIFSASSSCAARQESSSPQKR